MFLQQDVIALGWEDMGDLQKIGKSREDFKKRYLEIYPNASKGKVAGSAGMMYRFVYEAQVGDYVVFPSKIDRMINIGVIDGDYEHVCAGSPYVQQRKVKWKKHLPRTAFSQGALYEVGSSLSFFSVRNYADEYMAALDEGFQKDALTTGDVEDESIGATADEIVEGTKDFILKELSKNLKGFGLEDFVSDLLRAMGYRTKRSPQGGDSGIDITAYKNEFPPRILVQVKSQDGDIKEATIQSLKGAMREGDYGLFVSLSGYTKKARKYLDNTPIIRGIDGSDLADLITTYYDQLADPYKKMIPLRKVYIPVAEQE